ncbi:polyprenyl synthetase family protein [Moraxella catarrhalis]|jgi:geranyltranstransferase|uniref:polyprenyl synthetase family protein n=1 Tax=Moraxella catarrhalis TaxID=480 RepID=UPI000EAAC8C0|nr:farnesyl diphosphate synthase [Moraxella catarrhalis]MPW69170.1 polyprenyl synthetase family protein [Moraxella catarrhalis]MPX38009.1 polyprenyl synthetase family protein [Moraxella catarrhalis]MPX63311.1 polyprenyl synthetase family protein [Moraxella catarrhalis]RKM19863.1 polyprenyl synthetase family protein [Moraxella catarrhalis]RKM20060.1 polyprenyl synthetase family protein [Moraxella catarrhalis]
MSNDFIFDFSTPHTTAFIQNAKHLDQVRQWQTEHLPKLLDLILTQASLPEPLNAACRYAMSNGGKRVRPLLALSTFLMLIQTGDHKNHKNNLTKKLQMVCRAMMAVELIHSYSLIHDDLPCMDDDALRRGQPTCHIVYGEDIALLAGDALQSIAFEVLSEYYEEAPADEAVAYRLTQILSTRARRMVSGQMLDIKGENQVLTQDELEAIHRDKTGALIEASVMMGAICAGVQTSALGHLKRYARAIGLAFQVQDDVLDITTDTITLGKPAGSDEKLEKSTYVKLLGVDGAQEYANQLFEEARSQVKYWGDNNLLLQITDWLQTRKF